jgi:flagellin
MTIWFSTNIPEMRAISTFKRVSTDIADIQQRITTGLRINSGKDDPGGLVIREGLRADIKSINGAQSVMTQAQAMTDTAAGGIMQLIEVLNGDANNPSSGGMLAMLDDPSLTLAQKTAQTADFMKLYDAVIAKTTYNAENLIGTTDGLEKTFQLGDGTGTLAVKLKDLSAANVVTGGITAPATTFADDDALAAYREKVAGALDTITTASGNLGLKQQIVAVNQKLLDTRLTNVTAAEVLISNVDMATESSRMARAELLAQNAMSSIQYTRQYAAFAVRSLFG